MLPAVYVETTVISYLTARPSRDLIVAGHQQLTDEWWANHLHRFEPFLSPVVMDEISKGDPIASRERLKAIADFKILEMVPEAQELADLYFAAIPLPERARADSLHLALAAWHGMDFLVTWNCRHIASGFVRRVVDEINRERGIGSPVVCTPEELMEIPDV